MHNAESERIRDMVLLWHMKYGKEEVVVDYRDSNMVLNVLDLKRHEYLWFDQRPAYEPRVRLTNKALKLIGAQQHDTQN